MSVILDTIPLVIYAVMAVGGFLLTVWAQASLPAGTAPWPVPVVQRTTNGPYRWLDHPAYVGIVLWVAGLAGLAAGIYNALAVGSVAELVVREWAWRERGSTPNT